MAQAHILTMPQFQQYCQAHAVKGQAIKEKNQGEVWLQHRCSSMIIDISDEVHNGWVSRGRGTLVLCIGVLGNRRGRGNMWGFFGGFARNQPPHMPPTT